MNAVCLLITSLMLAGVSDCSKSGEEARSKVKSGLNIGDVCINPKDSAEMVRVKLR